MTPSLKLIDERWNLFFSDGKIYQLSEAAALTEGAKACVAFDRDGDDCNCIHADGTTSAVPPVTFDPVA